MSTRPLLAPGWFLLGGVLALAPGGCTGGSLPKTYPVTGTVVFKGGGPLAKASILFTPVGDTSFSVSGDVGDNGSFTLSTVKGAEKVTGAPEGEYRVSIQLPIRADQRPVPPIVLPRTYRVEPKENVFPIEVDGPRKP
jgi:hypothetical protein